jgi:hypothetical protein
MVLLLLLLLFLFTSCVSQRLQSNVWYTAPEPERRRNDRAHIDAAAAAAEPAGHTGRLKASDVEYDGRSAVTSYINRLDYMSQTYSEAAILAPLPTAMKDKARDWFDRLL